jgi:hypothetical protein
MLTEVCSPINRKSNAVPMPGAKSNPSRANSDSVPKQPTHDNDDARRGSKKPAAGLAKITGPEE